MLLKKGEKPAKENYFECEGDKHEIVSLFKYLGVTMRTIA
jgi:hypothetical protein